VWGEWKGLVNNEIKRKMEEGKLTRRRERSWTQHKRHLEDIYHKINIYAFYWVGEQGNIQALNKTRPSARGGSDGSVEKRSEAGRRVEMTVSYPTEHATDVK